MRIKELTESKTARTDHEGNVYDFHWQEEPMGFYVTVNDKPVANGFFAAKDMFNRSDAQEQARKLALTLASDAIIARRKVDDYNFQYKKPLSKLEQEWAEMQNRFMSLSDEELARWERLWKSGTIRKSLQDGTHPAVKK
jgi:hypothetical protein